MINFFRFTPLNVNKYTVLKIDYFLSLHYKYKKECYGPK